jgi:transposase
MHTALGIVHPNAAGIDSGADLIVVAIPPDRDAEPVRAFGTTTPDLEALVAWLLNCGIDTTAMEATGVYWVPLYDALEARGLVPFLVNAHHVKMVPGRKSDWNDAQWLQQTHALGLLGRSFRPDAEIVELRALVRHRAELLQHHSPHVLHIHKALKLMNIQLSEVVTDVMGVTGQAIIRAIVAGQRDPLTLAQLRHPSCKSSNHMLAKALTGTWAAAQLFILTQALALYDFYTSQVTACDEQIEQVMKAMRSRGEEDAVLPQLPPAKEGSKSKNAPSFNARAQLARIVGVDLVTVTGLSASTVQTIVSEIGTDMNRFPSVKHFCSWLGLAPHNDISGGKVLRSRTMKVVNRAAQAFRQAAQSVSRSDSAFGAFFRTLRARKGPQQAIVATAHKIARVVYHLLKEGEAFVESSAQAYEQSRRERELRQLQHRAHKLGYDLVTAPSASSASPNPPAP